MLTFKEKMRLEFLLISLIVFCFIGMGGYFWQPIWLLLLPAFIAFVVGLVDMNQKKRAVLKNFPVIGRLRYFFEAIRPEIQQYFVENNTDGTPFSREYRSIVYQRAKRELDTVPFGTQRDVYGVGYEWINHSLTPQKVDPQSLRVLVGGTECKKPYSCSIFNIAGMSYGSLSKNAILALNGGAKMGHFYHNTGEGSISPYHRKPGGDIVWQIGTGYFGCRDKNGNFCEELFQENAQDDQIKMIELKLSQGAKPAHGGILPARKITPEIARIRNVPMGKDIVSPSYHSTFQTPRGLLHFVQKLRELSGYKPIGFKLCIGHRHEFIAICQAMVEEQIYPDFIAVDGGEGGTGAAPLEFSNAVGTPLDESLVFVHDVLKGYDLRKHIKLICSGKIITAFQMLNKIALGGDILTSGRGMMLALGCIQARKCNSNQCPVGVATQKPHLVIGLNVTDKKRRVYYYHKQNIHYLAALIGATGSASSEQIKRSFLNRRINKIEVKTYEELFPSVTPGDFLKNKIPQVLREYIQLANPNSFKFH